MRSRREPARRAGQVWVALLLWLVTVVSYADASPDATAGSGRFVSQTYTDATGSHRYHVYLPAGYSADRNWPVVLFLHGAGERGKDGVRPLNVGLGTMLRRGIDLPAIVVFPQCEDINSRYLTGWLANGPDGSRAREILASVEREYSVDTDRRILVGWSMGGYGAWDWALHDPDHWSAILALAGGGDPESPRISALAESKTPVWAIHGSDDALIPAKRSREMVEAVSAAGGTAIYTKLPGVGHDVWEEAFLNEAVVRWMLDPASVTPGDVDWSAVEPRSTTPSPFRVTQMPFHPLAIVRGAVRFELGNDSLRTIAEGVPALVDGSGLHGELDDIEQTIPLDKDDLSLVMRDVRYEAGLAACRLSAVSAGRMRARFGLRSARMFVGKTRITHGETTVQTSAIEIVLGHVRPCWINIEVNPQVDESGAVRLELLSADFTIDDDNWYVRGPQDIDITGEGWTREMVHVGLVGGLYLQKETVEQKVRDAIPGLLEGMSGRLQSLGADDLAKIIWPLPVLAPQLRLRPAALHCSEAGLSAVLDVAVGYASIDPEENVRTYELSRPSQPVATDDPAVEISVAMDVVRAISESVSQATELTRINVLDLPSPEFHRLADPEVMRPFLPAEVQQAESLEVRTILILTGAFDYDVIGEEASGETRSWQLALDAPHVRISLDTRTSGGKMWKPASHFDLALRQPVQLTVPGLRDNRRSAEVSISWADQAGIKVTRFVRNGTDSASEETEAIKAFEDLFATAWRDFTQRQPTYKAGIPAIVSGPSRLSPHDVRLDRERLWLQYTPARTWLHNRTGEPLRYLLRSASTRWAGPFTIPAEASHEFTQGYELLWKTAGNRKPVHVLEPGREFEFDERRGLTDVTEQETPEVQESVSSVRQSP